jgi:hypothetical protein
MEDTASELTKLYYTKMTLICHTNFVFYVLISGMCQKHAYNTPLYVFSFWSDCAEQNCIAMFHDFHYDKMKGDEMGGYVTFWEGVIQKLWWENFKRSYLFEDYI